MLLGLLKRKSGVCVRPAGAGWAYVCPSESIPCAFASAHRPFPSLTFHRFDVFS